MCVCAEYKCVRPGPRGKSLVPRNRRPKPTDQPIQYTSRTACVCKRYFHVHSAGSRSRLVGPVAPAAPDAVRVCTRACRDAILLSHKIFKPDTPAADRIKHSYTAAAAGGCWERCGLAVVAWKFRRSRCAIGIWTLYVYMRSTMYIWRDAPAALARPPGWCERQLPSSKRVTFIVLCAGEIRS